MQQVLRMPVYDYIDGVQKPLQIAFFDKRRTQVRHDEIAREQSTKIRQVDEHPIPGFASLHRDQLNACSADVQLSALLDRHVRPEAAHVGKVEILTEELSIEDARRRQVVRNLFPIIIPGVKTRPRSERAAPSE